MHSLALGDKSALYNLVRLTENLQGDMHGPP